jgi:regulator of protease activity HflC (stomatin/prohibitin superfamily)
MRKALLYPVVLAFACTVALAACTTVAPDAGFEAVIVRKPFLFGHGGVDETPVKTGRSYFAVSSSAIYIDVRPLQFQEHFEDLMSSDGVPLDFDAALRLQVTNSVAVIRDFGPEWYQRNVSAVFRKLVRDAVKQHSMNETAISASAAEEIDGNVSASLTKYLADAQLPVRLIDVTLGRANPPDAIKHQRVATAEQEQRSNTERQRKLAEDQRKEAEAARAAADNAYREAMRLSPDQFLQLEQIKMLHEVCGGGKCTFLLGNGAVPTLNVK